MDTEGALQRLGDDRRFETTLRSLHRVASGEARVSGEMRATLSYLERMKRRNAEQIASLERQLHMLRAGRAWHQLDGRNTTPMIIAEAKRLLRDAKEERAVWGE